jgi:hypothetical protein
MSSKLYAKDQAVGFTNRIERVAIAGVRLTILAPLNSLLTLRLKATGTLATHIISHVLSLPNPPTITALVRPSSTHPLPASVIRREVDYASAASLTAALHSQQFLIICLAATAPPSTNVLLIRAAASACVSYVMPNAFGYDLANEELCRDTWHAMLAKQDIALLEEVGVSWVAMVCGLWYEYSMAMGEEWFGFDFANKRLTLFDDGTTRVNVTTWEQCGRAVAGLLALRELPDDEHDKAPSLGSFRNKPLYVSSFLVSQRDMFASWKRVSGEKDEEWTISHEGSMKRYQRGVKEMEGGSMSGRATAMFSRGWYENGDGNYEERYGLANGVLGLPKEDLDDATKRAKAMVEEGYREEKMRAVAAAMGI